MLYTQMIGLMIAFVGMHGYSAMIVSIAFINTCHQNSFHRTMMNNDKRKKVTTGSYARQ
jgi:hypothetical protein